MYLQVECNVIILTPFKTIEEQIVNQVLLAEAVIVGTTPDTYYNIDDSFAYKIGFCHLGVAKEISQTYYLRMLQTLNFQLSLDIQEHFIYLMEVLFPKLNINTTNNT